MDETTPAPEKTGQSPKPAPAAPAAKPEQPARPAPAYTLRPAAIGALKIEGTAIKQRFQDAAENPALLAALHRQYDQRMEHIIARLPEGDAIPEPPARSEGPRRVEIPAPVPARPAAPAPEPPKAAPAPAPAEKAPSTAAEAPHPVKSPP